ETVAANLHGRVDQDLAHFAGLEARVRAPDQRGVAGHVGVGGGGAVEEERPVELRGNDGTVAFRCRGVGRAHQRQTGAKVRVAGPAARRGIVYSHHAPAQIQGHRGKVRGRGGLAGGTRDQSANGHDVLEDSLKPSHAAAQGVVRGRGRNGTDGNIPIAGGDG